MNYLTFLLLTSSTFAQEILVEPELDIDITGASSSSKFTCNSGISRLFEQPFNKLDEYFSGSTKQFVDYSFYFKDQLYWYGFTPNRQIQRYESDFRKGSSYWNRLSAEFPRATLWGSQGVRWDDANQGQTATCYLVAGMSSVAELDRVIEDLFVIKEVNQ